MYTRTVCFVVVRADGPRTTTAVKDPILVLILVHIKYKNTSYFSNYFFLKFFLKF